MLVQPKNSSMASMISSMESRVGASDGAGNGEVFADDDGSRPNFLATTVPEAYSSPSSFIFLSISNRVVDVSELGTPAVFVHFAHVLLRLLTCL